MTSKRVTLPGPGNADRMVVIKRRLVRLASVQDEEWVRGEPVDDPDDCIVAMKKNAPIADIFSFSRALPETTVRHPYHVEWENAAVAATHTFSEWWESLPQEARKNVRRSERRGVSVRRVAFDDQLVAGIQAIYNESPIRQGRRFPHYGKSIETVKAENGTYLEQSEFLGAFFNNELIGFIKFVKTNQVARIMQIVALDAHSDKRPTNALLAKAVELCCETEPSHLVYGRYVYGKKENSPVTEFKRRNGFVRMLYPRYYVPLTLAGEVALRCGLHRELNDLIPERIMNIFFAARSSLNRRKSPPSPVGAQSQTRLTSASGSE